jgi:hypothetical protein
MNDWNLQTRAHACQACERPFADRQPYHTLLLDARHEYHRLDVCEPCWKNQYGEGASDRKGFVSHWQGVYEAPPAAPPDPIQKDTAETLLRKLTEQNDPQYRDACFILAVMLERKKLLKVKAQSQESGFRVFVYEQPKTGDLFTVPDPNLKLDQLDEVQRHVAHLLEHGLNPPVPVPSPSPAPAPESAEASAATVASAAGDAGAPPSSQPAGA